MNIQEIYDALVTCQNKLEEANIEDDSKLDLDILCSQLKKQLISAAFDPLKDLDNVTIADLSKLDGLTQQVDQTIQNENKRIALVKQITSIAKVALKAAGLPIPS